MPRGVLRTLVSNVLGVSGRRHGGDCGCSTTHDAPCRRAPRRPPGQLAWFAVRTRCYAVQWLNGIRDDEQARLVRGIRRMGAPSWWIIDAIATGSTDGIPAFEIIRSVEATLRQAGYPIQRLGAATTHHALERMEQDGFLRRSSRELEVPAGHGATRREERAVWQIDELGASALQQRRALDSAFAQRWRTGLRSAN
jgi:hypothetical protein